MSLTLALFKFPQHLDSHPSASLSRVILEVVGMPIFVCLLFAGAFGTAYLIMGAFADAVGPVDPDD